MKKSQILSNPGLKILSFVLAVLLWLVVGNIQDTVTTKQFKDVPVTVINENVLESINKVYEIKSGDTATFTIKGRRSVLDSLTEKDFKVVADMSHLSYVNAIPVEVIVKNDDLSIEVYRNDNTMVVSLEDELESSFSVTVETKGDVAEGYAVGETVAEPVIVDVKGPKSLIKKIDKVVAYADVDQKRSDFKENSDLTFFDKNGEVLDSDRIIPNKKKVKVNVQILPTKKIRVNVSTVGKLAKGYSIESMNYEPQEIEVAGLQEELNKISTLEIADIDISGLDKNAEYSVKVADYLPQGISTTEIDQKINITVNIGKIGNRTMYLSADQIDVSGGSTKYKYKIESDGRLEIILHGFQHQINNLAVADLKPMVDVSGLSAGTYVREVTLATIDGVDLKVVGTVSVKVEKIEE